MGFDYSKAAASPSPALKNNAMIGTRSRTNQTEGENAVGTTAVTLTIGADAIATQVLVENLNVRGEGTFKRVPGN
jgi:hypothetical protein